MEQKPTLLLELFDQFGYIDQTGQRNMELDKAGGVLLLLGLITIPSSSFFSIFCPAELFF